MGRKGRFGHGHRRQKGDQDTSTTDKRGTYVLTPKENQSFEQYYKGQKLILEAEWDKFMAILREPLPATFRITGSRSSAAELLRIIKSDYLNELVDIEVNGRHLEPTKCLHWYPDELAWQLDLDRMLIRQNDRLKRLHQFLVQETESGHMSRQEAVSMIPPLLLDVQPNSKVLDMCAAPGSKTAQLIEMLHVTDTDTLPEGFVVANDNDNKRCYLMVHQVRRLASPNFLVMNMNAAILPAFTLQESSDCSRILQFDRILCDVPCSGDGTLRKNVDAWQRWNPAIGHGLHSLQVRLLKRGLELLEADGRIVYSTCSLNPVEDEAVICAVLTQMNGSVELVDVSDELPGLIRDNGVSTWRIMSKFGDWYETYDEVPNKLRSQILPSMFPPTAADVAQFALHRCIRVLPHKQNSGGFFVAVLHKKRSLQDVRDMSKSKAVTSQPTVMDSDSTRLTSETNVIVPVSESSAQPATDDIVQSGSGSQNVSSTSDGPKRKRTQPDRHLVKKTKYLGYREDPFIFLQRDDPSWAPIQQFYGISSDFPSDQLMVRCEKGKKRNVYFVSSIIKQLVQTNAEKFKFINLGVKMFGRSESKDVDCEFRLVQDGVHLLFPYMTKRVVYVGSADDIVTLLSSDYPFIQRMSKITQEQLNSFDQGGCVFVYRPTSGSSGPQCQLLMCGWKGRVSCRSFLPKCERGHYLRLCGSELPSRQECSQDEKATESEMESDVKASEVLESERVESQSAVEMTASLDNDTVDTVQLQSEKEEDITENITEDVSEDVIDLLHPAAAVDADERT